MLYIHFTVLARGGRRPVNILKKGIGDYIHFVICTVSFTTLNLFYSGYVVERRELEKIIQEWVFHFEEKLQRNPRLQQDREAALYGDDCIKYGNAPLTAKEQIKQNRRIKTK